MGIGPVGGRPTPQGPQRSEGDPKTQSLLQGQIVTGKVMQLGPEGAMVEVGGRLFALTVAMSLIVGQQVPLLVKEGGPNPVLVPVPGREGLEADGGQTGDTDLEELLRSLGLPADRPHREALRELLASGRPIASEILRQLALALSPRLRTTPQQETTDAALGRLLESLDLPDDEPHLLAARQLLARGLPVTRGNVEQLTRTLARLRATTEADFEAAAYLRANSLPVTASTLELAKATLRDPHALGRQLHTVRTVLAMLADALESSPPMQGQAGGRDAQRLVEQAAQQLSQRILMAEGDDRFRLVESLRRLFKDQGTSLENRLAGVLAGEADLSGLEEDLRALLGRLMEAAQAAGGQAREETELRRAAALLRETAGELADGLQAQQLRNVAEPARGAEQWLSFQLPFSGRPGDYPRTAELRIGREPGKEIDADHLRLVFRLELERLRTVEVRLLIVGKQLTCSLASDSKDSVPLLQGEFGSLEQALEGLGYSVVQAGVSLLAEREGSEAGGKGVPEQLPRVDFRA